MTNIIVIIIINIIVVAVPTVDCSWSAALRPAAPLRFEAMLNHDQGWGAYDLLWPNGVMRPLPPIVGRVYCRPHWFQERPHND